MTTQYGATGTKVVTNPYPVGQCTWGVWQYIHDNFKDANGNPIDMPDMPGNADAWVSDAQTKNWTVSDNPTEATVAVWGTDMYPDGHVAFVTKVDLSSGSSTNPAEPNTNLTQDFVVYEANFDKSAPYPPPAGTNGYNYVDTRTIQMGSKEANSVKGFIELSAIGIQPGTGAEVTPGSTTSPWADLAAGIQTAEASAEQDFNAAVKKMEAAAQITGGMMVMAAGIFFLQAGLRGQPIIPTVTAAPRATGRAVGRNVRTFQNRNTQLRSMAADYAAQTGALPPGEPEPQAALPPHRAALEGARDLTLGPESRVAASATQKVIRGRMADMTDAEVKWATANPAAIRDALKNAPSGRVTSAGRTRIL